MSESDAPPSYNEAVKVRNGIPPAARRSMEDESRQLPEGWVRQYDFEHKHQYFVDTRATPPRSIWHHPYDDDQYLSSLDSSERERIQTLHRSPTDADIEAESTDEEAEGYGKSPQTSKLGPRPLFAGDPDGPSAAEPGPSLPPRNEKPSVGRRWKDKLTGTTHEQRAQKRRERAEKERQAYEAHQALRNAMSRAMQTGEPQRVGKDRDGHDLYVEPPTGPGYTVSGYPGYRSSGNYYSPYSSGIYNDPNARFLRPTTSYGRPYGYGYGGGLGLPLAAGLGGGLLFGGLVGAGL